MLIKQKESNYTMTSRGAGGMCDADRDIMFTPLGPTEIRKSPSNKTDVRRIRAVYVYRFIRLLQELDSVYDEHFGVTCAEVGDSDRVENGGRDLTGEWSDVERTTSSDDRCRTISSYIERTNGETESSDSDHEFPDNFKCVCPVNCVQQFERNVIASHILNICELQREEKEMLIMGSLHKFGNKETKGGKRKRVGYKYAFEGNIVCRSVFCHIFDIGKKSLKNIQQHLNMNGPVPRTHGNSGRQLHHALHYTEIKHCVDFFSNYADLHGLPQPAAPRGRDEEAPVYLSSSLTKVQLHAIYREACVAATIRQLGLTSFKDVWKSCVPHIKISTPKDDVCQKCELIRKQVADVSSEADKLKAASALQLHIQDAQREREVYKDSIIRAADEMAGFLREDGPVSPLKTDLKNVHYTFDYSQMVTLPHHSRQMGPIYFVTGRKLQIFGVRVDGVPVQYNYLIDEEQSIGADGTGTHGPNSVISMMHHCLFRYGYGKRGCVLHADNCGGQNKNRFVIAYLCWRIMQGLHEDITLHMQVPGHTRCLVDSGFAHIKKLFRRSDCDCIDEVAALVNKSSISNRAVLFKNSLGEQTWIWYNWKDHLKRDFLPVKGIQNLHAFRFSSKDRGAVFVKQRSDGPETRVQILRHGAVVTEGEWPESIQPGGLSRERQIYLHKTVRPFVRPAHQNTTCPNVIEE